jgi:tetratricopeptide (TPR) repeat protein
VINGNWISGIPFIDNIKLGSQDKYPSTLKNNKGRNVYYMLPLLLGLAGLFYHFNRHKKYFSVVTLLFVFTGIAIAVYLNEVPITPRERDYAVGGSFYVFSIWIGLGVLALLDMLKKKNWITLGLVFIATLILVPGIMARENWDDHDRSNRYVAHDIAYDYLNSCEPNAILFTNADNDTYPLWYAQEVEGIRRDVRIVLLPFLNANWYIEKLTKPLNDAEAIPMSIKMEKYYNNELEYVPFYKTLKQPENLKTIMEFVASNDPDAKVRTQEGEAINYFPTNKFLIPVDTALVVNNGTVSKRIKNQVVPAIEYQINKNYILKGDLVVLDIIANNNWRRPIYFLSTQGPKAVGLENYLQQEGFAYKLVPVKSKSDDYFETGNVDPERSYNLLMNKFKWGNMKNPKVYLDHNIIRTTQVLMLRNVFARCANELLAVGRRDSAIAVLDKCMEVVPPKTVPYDVFTFQLIQAYLNAGAKDKALKIKNEYAAKLHEEQEYYMSLPVKYAESVDYEKRYNEYLLQQIAKFK